MGGELAKLAFDYLVANTPERVKREVSSTYNTAVTGRYKAFKNWLSAAWTGKSNLQSVIGDYEDYLALFGPDESTDRLSLHEFFDATRAGGDEGVYKDYYEIMDRMGQAGERSHYINVRQESRAKELARQNAKISNGIHLLEKHIAGEMMKGKKPEDFKKSPFVSFHLDSHPDHDHNSPAKIYFAPIFILLLNLTLYCSHRTMSMTINLSMSQDISPQKRTLPRGKRYSRPFKPISRSLSTLNKRREGNSWAFSAKLTMLHSDCSFSKPCCQM